MSEVYTRGQNNSLEYFLTSTPRVLLILDGIQLILIKSTKSQCLSKGQIGVHELGGDRTVLTWIATGLGLRPSLGQPAPQEAQFVQQCNSFFGEILGLGYPRAALRTDPFAELSLRIHLAVFVFTTVLK